MENLVVVGNGMAGVACLEQILKHSPKFRITVFGDETHVNYNRILLSSVLAGEKRRTTSRSTRSPGIRRTTSDCAWESGSSMWTRRSASLPETTARPLPSTGCCSPPAAALLPPISGLDKQNVFTFRTLDDTRALLDRAKPGVKAVVIGGGLLGLEAARGLQVQGCEVTVIHLMDTLMNMQLDVTGGLYLKAKMEEMGVQVLVGRVTQRLLGNGHVEGRRVRQR